MPPSAIQAAIYAGYGAATAALGAPFCDVFRTSDPTSPLQKPAVGAISAAFDSKPSFSFDTPSGYGKPVFFGLFDASTVLVGDYLVSPTNGILFVASLEPLHPPMLVQCNETIASLSRPTAGKSTGTGFGAQGYGGLVPGASTAIITGFPCSLLQDTKGEKSDSGIPSDTREPWMSLLLPALPGGIEIRTNDELTTERGHRYTVSSTELTSLGWRLTVALSDA